MAKEMPLSEPRNSPPSPTLTFPTLTRSQPILSLERSMSNIEASFSELTTAPPRLSTSAVPILSSFTPTKVLAHSTCITSILKTDGQMLCMASSNGLVYTGSESNVIRVWKLPEYMVCDVLKIKASCMVAALEASNDRIYAAYADCRIRVWRRTWDGRVKHVRVATIPSTGSYVRSYFYGKDKMMMKHKGLISSLAINTADDTLYSASLDNTVKVWRICDLKCIETIQAHSDPINAITVSEDGVLYTASDDATVRVWRRNFYSGGDHHPHSLIVTLLAKHSPVKTLTLTSDAAVLYGGCSDGGIHYWLKGWLSGQLQYGGSLPGHTHAVMCLASLGDFVISGSADCSARVWVREQDGKHHCLTVLNGHRGPIRCVEAFRVVAARVVVDPADEGCIVCTGGLDGVIKVWQVGNTIESSIQNAR